MRKFLIWFIIFISIAIAVFFLSFYPKNGKNHHFKLPVKIEEGYPMIEGSHNQILKYDGFHLSYNEQHEQAEWVVYILTRDMIENGNVKRKEHFEEDENVSAGSAELSDYRNSGYDRGHLAPAADMKWSEKAMDQSFLLSNISPQNHNFNAGIWKRLEEKIRDWAVFYDSLYVVTGPVLKNISKTIGENEVSVPESFYKAVLIIKKESPKAIAFLMSNRAGGKNIDQFVISIDSLESITGIDFFHALDDSLENILEHRSEFNLWN
jgi:endonuclease G, mitochondrial